MMEFPNTLIFLRPLLITPLFLGRALGSPDRFFFFCLILPILVVVVVVVVVQFFEFDIGD